MRATRLAAVLSTAALSLLLPSAASATVYHATDTTFDSIVAGASGGDTIYVADGDYDPFTGVTAVVRPHVQAGAGRRPVIRAQPRLERVAPRLRRLPGSLGLGDQRAQPHHHQELDVKSECSSANRACFCRAASSLSDGRSRGSGIDRRGRDDEHLAHAALVLRLQDHPAQPRVDRQLRQPSAQRGDRSRSRRTPRAPATTRCRRARCADPAGRGTGSSRRRRCAARPSAAARAARLVRRISGSVNRGRDSKSCSE